MHTTQTYQIGDNVEIMRKMRTETIDLIVTSPPYWGLRDYGVAGQIGLERTLEEYHERLLGVTAECMRVLKPTGAMFWNHGDSYGGKSLCMQNTRLIIKMIDDQGWILRNRIIWNKSNCMPSSVTDRFTNKYEPVYMLTKNRRYWFDLDAVRVPHAESSIKRISQNNGNPIFNGNKQRGHPTGADTLDPNQFCHALGKNPGDVWTIPTQPYPESHFATFPTALVEPMIKAGCPEGGTVLDPFCGSGTVLEVCRPLNRNAIGLELNPEYEPLIKCRSMSHTPPLTAYRPQHL